MCVCNKCNSQDVSQLSEVEKNLYKGSEYDVDIEYSVCNSCDREFLSKAQIIANELKVREAKKEIDGLLSSEEIKCIRDALDLTQIEAANIFGGGRNAFSKYERSEVTQSSSMDKLLRLASSDRYIFKKLLGLSSLEARFDFVGTTINLDSLEKTKPAQWSNNQFDIGSEVSRHNLRLVA